MGTLSGGQLRVLPSDGMGISCPASEPARPSLLPGCALEHVRRLALEPVQHQVQALQGNALLAHFQAGQARLRDAELPGEITIGPLPTLLPDEHRKLSFQRGPHARQAAPAVDLYAGVNAG